MRRPTNTQAWWVAGVVLAAGLVVAGLLAASGGAGPPAGDAAGLVAGAGDTSPAGPSAVVDGRQGGRAGSGGVVAVVDPLTGELVREPTPEMIDSGETAPDGWLRRRSADLVEMPLPQGGYIVDLEGRFQTSLVVSVAEDGSIETECLRGEGEGAEGDGDDR